MSTRTAFLAALLAVVSTGCVERTSYVTSDESDRVGPHLLAQPPKQMDHRLEVDFDGKVTLLGYDLAADVVQPGGKVEVTWYWQCTSAPGPGWRLFTHAVDDKGDSRVNHDDEGPIRRHFQPEHWREGTVVRDPQRIPVPEGWPYKELGLRVGLWEGKGRMEVRSGKADEQGRAVGPVVRTVRQGPLSVEVPRAPAPPVVDGVFADEAAWADAVRLTPLRHTMKGSRSRRPTEVALMWDDANLYVAFDAVDDHLQSKYTQHDDELWHEDVFEVFLDPRGDKKHYYELQVSPAGVVFDSHLPSYRKNQNDWQSGVVAKVQARGTLNNDGDDDKGWSGELAVPFAALKQGGGSPPRAGDAWRANFFRIDVTKERPDYAAWSPPMRGDFHALDRFGEIVFTAPVAPTGDAGAAAKGEDGGESASPAAEGDQ